MPLVVRLLDAEGDPLGYRRWHREPRRQVRLGGQQHPAADSRVQRGRVLQVDADGLRLRRRDRHRQPGFVSDAPGETGRPARLAALAGSDGRLRAPEPLKRAVRAPSPGGELPRPVTREAGCPGRLAGRQREPGTRTCCHKRDAGRQQVREPDGLGQLSLTLVLADHGRPALSARPMTRTAGTAAGAGLPRRSSCAGPPPRARPRAAGRPGPAG